MSSLNRGISNVECQSRTRNTSYYNIFSHSKQPKVIIRSLVDIFFPNKKVTAPSYTQSHHFLIGAREDVYPWMLSSPTNEDSTSLSSIAVNAFETWPTDSDLSPADDEGLVDMGGSLGACGCTGVRCCTGVNDGWDGGVVTSRVSQVDVGAVVGTAVQHTQQQPSPRRRPAVGSCERRN